MCLTHRVAKKVNTVYDRWDAAGQSRGAFIATVALHSCLGIFMAPPKTEYARFGPGPNNGVKRSIGPQDNAAAALFAKRPLALEG